MWARSVCCDFEIAPSFRCIVLIRLLRDFQQRLGKVGRPWGSRGLDMKIYPLPLIIRTNRRGIGSNRFNHLPPLPIYLPRLRHNTQLLIIATILENEFDHINLRFSNNDIFLPRAQRVNTRTGVSQSLSRRQVHR